MLELTAFPVGPHALRLVPPERGAEWMEATWKGQAFRCLPLVMARQAGWELLSPFPFTARWNGDADPSGVSLDLPSSAPRDVVVSHFGEGILSINTGWLFRTSPGHNLWVKGPTNRPKHGLHPLEALIETDWMPFTFGLNWLFTAPELEVSFEEGEPLGSLRPYPRHYLEEFRAERRPLEGELAADYQDWRARRGERKLYLGGAQQTSLQLPGFRELPADPDHPGLP